MNSFNNVQQRPNLPTIDEWYVYQESGQHVGPVTIDLLARGINAGKVPRNAYAGVAGDSRWRPVLEIPEIAAALRALEQQRGSAALQAPDSPAAAPPAAPPSSGAALLAPRPPSITAPPAPQSGCATPPRVAQTRE